MAVPYDSFAAMNAQTRTRDWFRKTINIGFYGNLKPNYCQWNVIK